MFFAKLTESTFDWIMGRRCSLYGIQVPPSLRRKPESSPTIAFAARATDWVPRSSRGMTVFGGVMTVLSSGMIGDKGGKKVFGSGMTGRYLSFRRKPESSPIIAFAEHTSGWVPRSSRGMTVQDSDMTRKNHRITGHYLSFRRKPESSPTIAFAERTSNWIPPVRRIGSSRGMTDDKGGLTLFGRGMTVLDGGMSGAMI